MDAVEGGESLQECTERVLGGWTELVDGLASDKTVAVITHGGPIRAVVASVTGRDLTTVAPQFSPSNCGLTEFECGGEPRIVRQDQTGHHPE